MVRVVYPLHRIEAGTDCITETTAQSFHKSLIFSHAQHHHHHQIQPTKQLTGQKPTNHPSNKQTTTTKKKKKKKKKNQPKNQPSIHPINQPPPTNQLSIHPINCLSFQSKNPTNKTTKISYHIQSTIQRDAQKLVQPIQHRNDQYLYRDHKFFV